MQAFNEQCETIGLAGVINPAMDARPVPEAELEALAVTESFVLEVLAAVTDMALRSKRRQADLGAAIRHAGIEAGHAKRLAALERLSIQGCIDKVVQLERWRGAAVGHGARARPFGQRPQALTPAR